MAQFLLSSKKWGFKLCPQRESHSFMTVMRLWYRPFFPSELLWLVPICIFSLSKFASQPIESFQLGCTIQFSIIRFQFVRQKLECKNCSLFYFESFNLMKLESMLYLKWASISFSLIDYTLCCTNTKPNPVNKAWSQHRFQRIKPWTRHSALTEKSYNIQVWLFFPVCNRVIDDRGH